jgi:dipeptide/tripeptide permease
MNTGGNGIGLLAPVITPLVSSQLGWTWGISLGAIIGLAGAICWFWIDPQQRTDEMSAKQT